MSVLNKAVGRCPLGVWIAVVAIVLLFLGWGMQAYSLFDWDSAVDLGLQNERWEALLYINNVLDDDTVRSGGSGPDFGPAMGDMGFSAGLVRTHYFGPLTPPLALTVN